MKKSCLLVMLVLTSILIITGCQGALAKYSGTYKLEYSKYVGDPDDEKSTEEWTITLNSDGTGNSNRSGVNYDIEWSIDGDTVKLTENFYGAKSNYEGTVSDNTLDLYNGNKNEALTQEFKFIKK